ATFGDHHGRGGARAPRRRRVRTLLRRLRGARSGARRPGAAEAQRTGVPALLRGLPEALHGHRYAEGKWSIREVAGHLADTERIITYRALRIARGDATPLPGFDENAYVAAAGFDARPLESLVAEWEAVREATLAFFRSVDAEAAARRGTANDNAVSVRALAHIVAGHAEHHLEILRTRYLG
ncbi:MAG TPA: DinB family protein, partial [Longimicrobiaceae bacterium]|nr:DinB family protein [Longimicrobiaceae bacterium]